MKIGIYGYGNLGYGIATALSQNPDMELAGIFTRRDPGCVISRSTQCRELCCGVPRVKSCDEHFADRVFPCTAASDFKDKIDVMIICGGSATDLPWMTPALVRDFNVIDSFDTHANIPQHFAAVDAAAKETDHIALISSGWDPGLFSVARLYMQSVMPQGSTYTFWGRGVSQGHSDAIRQIPGVRNACQYTVPVKSAVERVRCGEAPDLTPRQKHIRECYVSVEPNADKEAIKHQILTMPHYFDEYNTTVEFVSDDELAQNHSALPHGGCVIRTGQSGGGSISRAEFSLDLESNPEFTSSAMAAYARAIYKMYNRGMRGCKTVFDIAPADLSPLSAEELRKLLL